MTSASDMNTILQADFKGYSIKFTPDTYYQAHALLALDWVTLENKFWIQKKTENYYKEKYGKKESDFWQALNKNFLKYFQKVQDYFKKNLKILTEVIICIFGINSFKKTSQNNPLNPYTMKDFQLKNESECLKLWNLVVTKITKRYNANDFIQHISFYGHWNTFVKNLKEEEKTFLTLCYYETEAEFQ